MYVISEALRLHAKKPASSTFTAGRKRDPHQLQGHLDKSTKFIPTWVKVAVALALGLGTMVGWKRIVVTVGEKIGKEHLTYAQGAAAEIVAAGTIIAADQYRLPVSTTHVLSSGVAGTMVANGSGLQMATSATSPWPGSSPCPSRRCSPAACSGSSATSYNLQPCPEKTTRRPERFDTMHTMDRSAFPCPVPVACPPMSEVQAWKQ